MHILKVSENGKQKKRKREKISSHKSCMLSLKEEQSGYYERWIVKMLMLAS